MEEGRSAPGSRSHGVSNYYYHHHYSVNSQPLKHPNHLNCLVPITNNVVLDIHNFLIFRFRNFRLSGFLSSPPPKIHQKSEHRTGVECRETVEKGGARATMNEEVDGRMDGERRRMFC